MLLLLSCHNVQEWPLWSHNMPHLLTGTVNFTNSLKDIYSLTHTPVQPHSGIVRYDTNLALCNVMMSSDMIHITVQYMIILPLSSQTRPYANAWNIMSICYLVAIILIPFAYLPHISQVPSIENKDLTVKIKFISSPCEYHHNIEPTMMSKFSRVDSINGTPNWRLSSRIFCFRHLFCA